MSRFRKAVPYWKRPRKRFVLERRIVHYAKLTRMHRRRLRALLKQARLRAKLNQRTAGELIGQDQTFISKIETGKRQVEFVEVTQLAAVYKKPLSFFATIT